MGTSVTSPSSPAHQGKKKGRGGTPPVEHRFKPGQSGNPAGRPSAGAAVKELLNLMQDWTREQLEAVINDKAAPVVKVAAARIWLTSSSTMLTSSGAPVAGSDIDRICDRTDGKDSSASNVSVNVTVKAPLGIQELARELEQVERERVAAASRMVPPDRN